MGKRLLEKPKIDLAEEIFDWAQSLVFAFVGIVLLFAFGVSVFSVSQQSMTNTLQEGEMVMISRLPYTPRHDDVILFTKYGWRSAQAFNADTGQYNPMVKRVIGIAGDELFYDDETDTLYRNGDVLDEYPAIIREPMTRWAVSSPMPMRLTVPDGHVFVMGDNRNGSHDSRSGDIGFVDERSILGRVILRVWPFSQFGPV
jgi:signal peptidase I